MLAQSPSTSSVLLTLPLVFGVFSFAAAGEQTQLFLILLTIPISLYGLYEHSFTLSRKAYWTAMVTLLLCCLPLIPVPLSIHQKLSPNLFSHTGLSYELMEISSAPLAIRPREALKSLLILCTGFIYMLACASCFHKARRLKHTAHILCIIATALIILACIQRETGAQSIYWNSGIPAFKKEPFFGSYVNPNHAGALLAAILPFALALKFPFKMVYVPIIALGLYLTGSRGALLCGGVSFLSFYLLQARDHRIWPIFFIATSITTSPSTAEFGS